MSQQVTILGAGIVGICCALSLVQRGVSVRLIDRVEPGQSTSYGNAGVISPWSFIPMSLPGVARNIPSLMMSPHKPLKVNARFWPKMIPWGKRFLGRANETSVRSAADGLQALCGPSIQLYRNHLDGTGNENLIVDSCYVHAYRDPSRANLEAIDYRIRIERGADLEALNQKQLSDLEPDLSSEFKAAVLIKGQARALSPASLSNTLFEKARRLGAEFVKDEISDVFNGPNGWELQTTDRKGTAQNLVLAAGVWSKKLLEPLGVEIPLVPERGYHIEVSNTDVVINNSIMDVEAKTVASSMNNGLRLAGAAEFANSEDLPDKDREALLTRQVKAMFPKLKAEEFRFWMGRRPSFPDSLPIIGPIHGIANLYGAFGHSHFGLMCAPKTGELIADLLTSEISPHELQAYSSERFG